MHRIAIILTFIFTLFIVTPTILSVVQESFDISILLKVSEEENNQKEVSKSFDVKFSETKTCLSLFNSLDKKDLLDYYLKHYTDISQENTSPPPELV
ncbi:hypothetical protein CW731_10185 [Polaribacter sp. ALD11]|uniref:hypothetical protein n=1 Tax=Polaribacter sp. ALD11 TaxID=2058137 RepID=UPI000C310109|nr:hypothetical protein [Polaribacter sp. ALD11]AUC85632.1 hypothetical protein CW731_10185 [Polaribacter sp. ALD11]